jgi:hypothetical protein
MSKRKAPPSAKGDLRKQAQFDFEWAKRTLLETGDVPAVYIMRSPTKVWMLPTDMDLETKDTVRQTVRMLCMARNVDSLTLIAEAWISPPPEEGDPFVLPSQSDRRQEVVVVATTFYDASGHRNGFVEVREILRGDDGKPIGLADGEQARNKDGISGPTYEILPEERASAQDRMMAERVLKIALEKGYLEERQSNYQRER